MYECTLYERKYFQAESDCKHGPFHLKSEKWIRNSKSQMVLLFFFDPFDLSLLR